MRTFNAIVIGVDLAPSSSERVRALVRAACTLGAKRVHLVHVVHTSPMLPAPLAGKPASEPAPSAAVERAEAQLDALEMPDCDIWVHREVRVGPPPRELARAADEHHADLVVVSRRGHNPFTRLVLGSVPNGLIRASHCPVLVVDDDVHDDVRFANVLAAVDLSPVSRMVLENAVMLARAYGGEVQVLSFFERAVAAADEHAHDYEVAHRRHQEALGVLMARVRAQGVPLESHVDLNKGPIPPAIVDLAKSSGADVIVMGTSGRNAWHRMILGSTANHVLLRAPCAVLVVPTAAREEASEPAAEPIPSDPALGGNSPC